MTAELYRDGELFATLPLDGYSQVESPDVIFHKGIRFERTFAFPNLVLYEEVKT